MQDLWIGCLEVLFGVVATVVVVRLDYLSMIGLFLLWYRSQMFQAIVYLAVGFFLLV